MGSAIGDILPLAVGVAISPIPIIAAILMLLSPRAKVTSVGFLLGWIIGIVVAATAFMLLSALITESDPAEAKPIRGTIQIALGVLMLLLAVTQWRKRPKDGEEPEAPGWMRAIDDIGFPGAFGLGFFLAAINPKNLILAAGAGVAIGGAGLSAGENAIVIALYSVLAASTIAVPVVAYLVATERLRGPLGSLRGWLTRQNAVIMAVLFLVIGVSMIGQGIGSF